MEPVEYSQYPTGLPRLMFKCPLEEWCSQLLCGQGSQLQCSHYPIGFKRPLEGQPILAFIPSILILLCSLLFIS